MAKILRSVGLDVGTTSTQMILSELTVENQSSAFSVPEMSITNRRILYKSPIYFTPLLENDLVDGNRIRLLIADAYRSAGITPADVDTGAIIITGETSRKENAAAVLENISDFAGTFVVATAGPDLESILACKGAGAPALSLQTGKPVLHMDIGGGTSNVSLIRDGVITATGCWNVGGRLLKFDGDGTVSYVSPVLDGLFPVKPGDRPTRQQLQTLAQILTSALEMVAGLRPSTDLMHRLRTTECQSPWPCPPEGAVLSFSGGVADCIDRVHPDLAFGDLGPLLGQAIRHSALCRGDYRLGHETIRATVIGAGCHSTQLSGSTVFHQNIGFPLKNLPVVTQISRIAALDTPGVLSLSLPSATHYDEIRHLAGEIAHTWPHAPLLIAMETDLAKALGNALRLLLGKEYPILCIDRVRLQEGDYLDIGAPVASALPVVVKTLILQR